MYRSNCFFLTFKFLDLTYKLSSSEHECVKLRKDLAGQDQEMARLKVLLQEAERRNQEQNDRMRFLEMQQQQRALEQLGITSSLSLPPPFFPSRLELHSHPLRWLSSPEGSGTLPLPGNLGGS
jgi:hypothetical protein